PRHGHRRSRGHPFRHRLPFAGGCIDRIAVRIAATVDAEIEAVQMHRMRNGARVYDAPAHGIAQVVGESFSVRPGAAIDCTEEPTLAWNQLAMHLLIRGFRLDAERGDCIREEREHQHSLAFAGSSAGWIDDECSIA